MFSEAERAVFGYETGGGKRYADPLAIFRALALGLDGDLAGAIEAAQPPSDEEAREENPGKRMARLVAEGRLLDVVRGAFALLPFDPETGKGATDTVAWRALNAYLEWCEGEGQGGERSPTSPPGSPASPSP